MTLRRACEIQDINVYDRFAYALEEDVTQERLAMVAEYANE